MRLTEVVKSACRMYFAPLLLIFEGVKMARSYKPAETMEDFKKLAQRDLELWDIFGIYSTKTPLFF